MKILYNILLTTLLFMFSLSLRAQQIANLEGINYQAVAIDTDGKELVGKDYVGEPLYKTDLGVRFTITAGENGVIYYQETHSTTTNENGLFSLNIGMGELTADSDYEALLEMPWINGDQWLKVELALGDDGDYEVVSNEKFMAVPYSFYTHDIADDAITTYKILDSTILNQDFSTGAVDTRVILDSTILNEDFATGAVDTRVILDSTILSIDFSTGAVDTRVILDSTILNEDFATGTVDTRVILDSTILNEDFATGAVDTRVILDETIINEDFATGAVDTRIILDSTILEEDFATGAVDTRVILNETILNEDFADGTIDLTTKVNTEILPVENGGTGRDELTAERVLIGNGIDPIKTPPYPADSGQILTHINGVTEPYKIEAGALMSVDYDDVANTITFTAAEQDLGETGVGSVAGGNVASGSQVRRIFPSTGFNVGDALLVGANVNLNGLTLTGYVSSTDEVTFIFYNGTNGNVNIPPLDITVLNLGQ